ncbi:MAG TPA: exodeoxyribonuclease VII large subunit [Polyangia bacterium]|nr:exodeoxyribonuclease VII large subunit [Polyangia bacterium]
MGTWWPMPSEKPPNKQGAFDFGAGPPKRAEPEPVREPDRAPPIPPAPAIEKQEPRVFTVSDLVRGVARTVEGRFGMVAVEGEISNFSAPRSGHLYFTLKDAEAQLPSVMFRSSAERLKFTPHDGLVVRARGRCSIFEAQGKFQLYVDALEPAGLGALQLAFEQLKQKLAAEGLFDPKRKRPLPPWPRRIGIVTSPTGAAVRDILRIAERRGRMRFLISPCQVQGDTAPFEIIRAIRRVERHVDLVIVARGGGSAEDLAAFNDEALARAIASCRVPVVSAIGHEVDYTISDFVADVRAPTPSGAAELVVPNFAEQAHRLEECTKRLLRDGRRIIGDARLRIDAEVERAAHATRAGLARRRRALDADARRLAALHPRARLHRDRAALAELTRRLQSHPQRLFDRARAALDGHDKRLALVMRKALDERRRGFGIAVGKLEAMSPLAVLERGYSLTRTPDGAVITDAAQVAPGDQVRVRLLHGELGCVVQSSDRGSKTEGADE